MSGKGSEIQFIYSSQPKLPGVTSVETQRRVHSHAAWAAHARARRQRLVKYQAIKADSNSEKEKQPSTRTAAEIRVATIPSPISLLGSDRRDPFGSFARHLIPIEDFLLDYYMHYVVPCSKVQRNDFNHPESCKQYLNKQFIQLAATNSNSLDGLFLVASRHVSQFLPHMGPYFTQLALQYKIACARSLMGVISSLDRRSSLSDSTVTLPLFLAQDEILVGDITSTRRHIQGAIQMVKHNGVIQKIDFSAFPYDLIQKDMVDSSHIQPVTPLH
ncbi:hypothetical protein BP6252_06705 [Coleophoma cylindrospora]|uniref:Uncharacterized protein n=1 Tax=Coleophoma cylindrospora TaxID=1849047 RepID=A0A3D8RFS9_9HELO|nr:hypothetical protein BP6252_06705 [Coleophoma cylindrospora]